MPCHRSRDRLAQSVGAARDSAADGLADDEDVRLQPPRCRRATPARGEGVGLIDHQQRAIRVANSRRPSMKPGSGSTMPILVSAGSVRIAATSPCCERCLDRGQVVPDRRPGRQVDRHRRRDIARTRDRRPVRPGEREGLIDRPVIAVAEDENLRPPGRQARQPDRPAVRIGRRQAEAPQRHTEARGQLGADPLSVRGGEHRRRAALIGIPVATALIVASGECPAIAAVSPRAKST
jgi:hypothetical protein